MSKNNTKKLRGEEGKIPVIIFLHEELKNTIIFCLSLSILKKSQTNLKKSQKISK
jgi:hypothetical protein